MEMMHAQFIIFDIILAIICICGYFTAMIFISRSANTEHQNDSTIYSTVMNG